MTKLKVYLATHFDPWFNLATENYIFNDMDTDCHVLFLWRNEKTIVIGRNQNPWSECNVPQMEEDGIRLARRQTGGGAVYHDLGNTNFTFMSGRQEYSRDANSTIITQALAKRGIVVQASGRNDLVVPGDQPKKVSGAAFRETADRCFHHGTLLINADMSQLAKYLNPSKKKMEAKGIKSVRSRVANLCQYDSSLNHDNLVPDIVDSFFSHHRSTCPTETLDTEVLKSIPEINEYYKKLIDWDWRFGKTPKFTQMTDHRFEWGEVEVHLDFLHGQIRRCKIFSDCLDTEMIQSLSGALTGIPYRADTVQQACAQVAEISTDQRIEVQQFSDWFSETVK